jgi:ACR3 family arsenite transporter
MQRAVLEARPNPVHDPEARARLSAIDRFLPLWILLAMVTGIGLGRIFPDIGEWLDSVQVVGVSLPIAIGLLWMMYPVLAKVKFEAVGGLVTNGELMATSSVLNWVIGPLLMFGLAWAFLPDEPAYRTGLILIGLARCIAMVLIWNQLACGDSEVAAVLVAVNSVFQIVMYSVLGWLFLSEIPGWFGAESTTLDVSMWGIAKNVLIFLGIPLAAGFLTRATLIPAKGEQWYLKTFLPKIGPTALLGLLYTIVIMFAMQGDRLLDQPLDILRIALPMIIYFGLMFFIAFFVSKAFGFTYEETTAISFTAAGNNFELAIAVAVGVFGISSGEALTGVIGPLIEVPVLIALVYVALWLRDRYFPAAARAATGGQRHERLPHRHLQRHAR